MRKISRESAAKQESSENPSGGNAVWQKGYAITAESKFPPKNLQWITLYRYRAEAGVQKAMWLLVARNAITKKSTFFQWNGSSTMCNIFDILKNVSTNNKGEKMFVAG